MAAAITWCFHLNEGGDRQFFHWKAGQAEAGADKIGSLLSRAMKAWMGVLDVMHRQTIMAGKASPWEGSRYPNS